MPEAGPVTSTGAHPVPAGAGADPIADEHAAHDPDAAHGPAGSPEPAGTGNLPAVRDTSSGELWPWEEPWEVPELEPWEEIPIRLTLVDRAGAELEGSWRVAVTSLFPGSGTTTVTAALGLVFADARRDGVVAVDASVSGQLLGGPPADGAARAPLGVTLARRLGIPAPTTVATLARHRRDGFSPEEVAPLVAGTTARPALGRLDVVAARVADTRATSGGSAGAIVPADDLVTPSTLRAALGLLAGAYPLVLLDAPGDSPTTPTVLRGADVVVLVVLATPADLDAAAADLRDPTGLPARLTEPPPAVIAVLVPARRGRWSPQTRAAAARLARRVDGLIRLPYDARLDGDAGSPTKIGRLRRRSRRAFLRLAADVVDVLVDEVDTHAAEPAEDGRGAATTPVRVHGGDHSRAPGVLSDRIGP